MRDAGWMQYIKSSTGVSLVFTHLTLACLNLSHITLSNLSYIACLPSLVCLPLFLHFDSCSDSSIESLMACKSTPGAKKKPAAKAPAQERAVARKSSSAQRVASRKCVTLGEEDHLPVTATQASAPSLVSTSAPSLVSTSAPTSVRRTRTPTGAWPLVPASDKGMPTCYCRQATARVLPAKTRGFQTSPRSSKS